MIGKVYAIGLNTLREAVRSKVLYAIMFFALLLVVSSVAFAELALYEQDRVIKDFGLFALTAFSVAITIVTGVSLLYKEIDRKTIYTIVTKPVRRWQFLVGKFGGIVATVGLELALMGAVLRGVLWWRGVEVGWELWAAVWMVWVEVGIVAALATLLSAFSTPFLSGLVTVMLVTVGHLYDQVERLVDGGGLMGAAMRVGVPILPDLTLFNLTREVTYGLQVGWERLGYAAAYGVLYMVVVLVVGGVVIERRDFV
jgi:ABC-type transport system involved in multi-copper enzyme maturation permease subunit